MLLTPYASSSAGNLYEVFDGETRLLLECGLPLRALQAALPRPLSAYAACLLTHEHKDHSRAAAALLLRGVDLCCTAGTARALGLSEGAPRLAEGAPRLSEGVPRLHLVRAGAQIAIGSLRVKPFATTHDAAEPVGFLLESRITRERLLFATDTAYVRVRVPRLTEIAIECNHSLAQLEASGLPRVVRERARRTHMALETACAYLAGLDLRRVRRIWLLHLSAVHGDAEGFARAVRQVTGVETIACAAKAGALGDARNHRLSPKEG